MLKIKDNVDLKEILKKFNKEVEKAELTRNPYSNEDKKFKHILVSLSEEHFNIFKDTLDYITNLQEENERLRKNQKLTPEQRNHLHLELEEVLEIYKQRNEKAIRYMNNTFNITSMKEFYKHLDNIENILKGEDKE